MKMEPGISPRTAGTFVDELEEYVRALSAIAGLISRAYDAEMHRIYGYDFCRPLPNGEDSQAALREARAAWAAAVAAFKMPDVAAIDADWKVRDEKADERGRKAT